MHGKCEKKRIMPLARKEKTAIALAVWMQLVILFMILAAHANLEIFFALVLVGILVIAELSGTSFVQTRHQRYTRYIAGAGTILFGMIVAGKIMEILAA